jgi:3-mercaptopyruvate sulfurtransferase SseA
VGEVHERILRQGCLDHAQPSFHAGTAAVPAGVTLKELGYPHVSVLDGGMLAWQKAGLPVERGLSGVMAPPTDLVLSGPDRNFADMQNYLRWEEALGYKYSPQPR